MARYSPFLINVAAALAVALPAAAQQPQQPPPVPAGFERPAATVIRAARLIDGTSDAPKANAAVLVVGNRIQAVGDAAEVARQAPAGAQTIDLGDATLLPGLIDTHTHVL